MSTDSISIPARCKGTLHFPLGCDDSQKPYHWYFDRDFNCTQPALDNPVPRCPTSAQRLGGKWPEPVGPAYTGHPQRQVAAAPLRWRQPLGRRWRRRCWSIAPSMCLIYFAAQRWTHVSFCTRRDLVSRHNMTYLVATVNDYTDIRLFALRRIKEATLSETT